LIDTKYRNPKILRAAQYVENCFACGCPNTGNIVAAHSNQLRDGKGMGTKAHDFRVAFICSDCHTFVDSSKAAKEEKEELWERAHRLTIAYLILNGILK